jgi:NitT/TauT family transport system substrate-binding protein
MRTQHARQFSRRSFLGGLTLAGTAGLLGLRSAPTAAEPPPETTRVRVVHGPAVCEAPALVAEELLRGEGFTKGKTVAVVELGSPQYVLMASMLAYVGIDPRSEINWVIRPYAEQGRLLAEEQIDAFLAFPPFAQELRAKNIGHVIVDTARDRPWSQYFCCMAVGNREFVRKHPRATKRALRAILKATDICASEPERVARLLVDKAAGRSTPPPPNYDYVLQTMREIPYSQWREYDAEDTVRFFALRLHEVGLIKSTPQKLIAQGTDWRFFNELKKELKG